LNEFDALTSLVRQSRLMQEVLQAPARNATH